MRDGFWFGFLTTMAALPFALLPLPFVGTITPAGRVMLVLGGTYLAVLGIAWLYYLLVEEWERLRARSPEQKRQDRRAWVIALGAPILIIVFAALGPLLIVGYWSWRAVSFPFRKRVAITRPGQW